jgi:hypothetical protein
MEIEARKAIIKRSITILEKRLEESEKSDRACWEMYGSELAGDFCDGSKRIREQIRSLKKELNELNERLF